MPAYLPDMTPLAESARSGHERLLSIEELSEYLRVPVTTLYDWRANQKGPLASARYRNFDGSYSRVQVAEPTRKRAENALKAKLCSYVIDHEQEDINRLTKLTDVAALWLEELRLEERISPQTIEKYNEIMRSVVLEPLGNLRLQELAAGTIDRFLKALASSASPSHASLAKTVLRGLAVTPNRSAWSAHARSQRD
jgi:hypothetical protein